MPSKRKAVRQIAALMGDFHCGEKLGLLSPLTELPDYDENGGVSKKTYPVTLNEPQAYLWKLHTENIAKLKALARGDPIHVYHNGDLTQGVRFLNGLVSVSASDHAKAGVDCLAPLLDLPNTKSLTLIAGTEVHVGSNLDEYERRVVERLEEHKKYGDIPVEIFSHLEADFNGMLANIAHHGPIAGSRPWLTGNEMRYALRTRVLAEENKDLLPRLVVRGHYHVRVEETINYWVGDERRYITGLIVPSMSFPNAHARKITKSAEWVTQGWAAAEIVNGKLIDIHWFTKTRKLPTRKAYYG